MPTRTFGNFEGARGLAAKDTAKTFQAGFDLLAPGEGVQAHERLAEFGIKMAGRDHLYHGAPAVFQEIPQGRVALIAACPGANLCGTAALMRRRSGRPARRESARCDRVECGIR